MDTCDMICLLAPISAVLKDTPTCFGYRFSEHFIHLPSSYFPIISATAGATSANSEDISSLRRRLGLPDGAFTYCNLGHLGKIDMSMFAAWAAILQQRTSSVIWLLQRPAEAVANVQQQIEALSLTGRVIFTAKMDRDTYLTHVGSLCDVFLDTRHYNSHTVTAEVLVFLSCYPLP